MLSDSITNLRLSKNVIRSLQKWAIHDVEFPSIFVENQSIMPLTSYFSCYIIPCAQKSSPG